MKYIACFWIIFFSNFFLQAKPFIIGIEGARLSGKSYLAEKIKDYCEEKGLQVIRISCDAYTGAGISNKVPQLCIDHPQCCRAGECENLTLLYAMLQEIVHESVVYIPHGLFSCDALLINGRVSLRNCDIVIIEGVVLFNKLVSNYFDSLIIVQTEPQVLSDRNITHNLNAIDLPSLPKEPLTVKSKGKGLFADIIEACYRKQEHAYITYTQLKKNATYATCYQDVSEKLGISVEKVSGQMNNPEIKNVCDTILERINGIISLDEPLDATSSDIIFSH